MIKVQIEFLEQPHTHTHKVLCKTQWRNENEIPKKKIINHNEDREGEKEDQKTNGTNGKDNSIVNLKRSTYIITLCIKGLSTPVKCQRLSKWIKKARPNYKLYSRNVF